MKRPTATDHAPQPDPPQLSYRSETLGSPNPWKRYRVLITPCKLAAPIVQRQFPPEDSAFAGWVSGFVNLDGQPRPTCKQAGANRGSCNTLSTHVAQQRREAKAEADRLLRELDGRPPKKMPRSPRPKELAFDLPTKKRPTTEKNWRHVPLPHFQDEGGEHGEINLSDVAVECAPGDAGDRIRKERLVKLATAKLREVTDQRKANAIQRNLDKLKIFSPCFQSLTEK